MSAIGKEYYKLLTEEAPVVSIAAAAAMKVAVDSYGDDIPPDVQELLNRCSAALDELDEHFESLEAMSE